MEVGAIRQFITLLWKHYSEAAAKEQKKKIIDAIQTTLGYHRKSIIRLLSSAKPPELRRKSGNREPKYNKDDEKWLVRIWRSMGKICSERIVAALEDWIPALKLKLGLPQRIAEKLLEMSASTMDRKLAPYRNRERRQENTGTVRSIFTAIPIKPLGITVSGPGFVEIDSVAHCGGDLSGTFAWTISATDIATNMTFCRAVLGKSAEAVTAALLDIEKCFPFPIHTFWFDNGTEFINELVLKTFANRPDLPIRIERSRPYKKNDQAHIEEKNWTHVRQIFGYVRIKSKKAIAIMNKVYESAWCPLHNFYLPQSKTIEKWRVGPKVRRKVDKPKTPYTRLLESGSLSEHQSKLLKRQRNKHDPLDFKRELDLLFVDLRKEMGSRVLLMPRRFSEGLCLRSTEEAS